MAYAHIVLGCIIGGASYPLFMTPNNIAPGGLTGVGVILNYLFKVPVGTVSLVLNRIRSRGMISVKEKMLKMADRMLSTTEPAR